MRSEILRGEERKKYLVSVNLAHKVYLALVYDEYPTNEGDTRP
jgi:hypothetical protein